MALKKTLATGSIVLLTLFAGAAPAAAVEPYDDWNPKLEGFPSNTPTSPRANCEGGGDRCIDRTIGEMWRRFHTVFPVCDHNSVFSLTYLRVTEDIREAVAEDFYPDLHWINKQDAMFARIYFLNYDNWRAGRADLVPQSWQTTFGAGEDQSVQGLGNLLLSMNAHVNRDFPFILYHAGLVNPDGSSKKPDHDAYNERLRALYKPMLAELAHRFDETMDDYDIPGITTDDDALFSLLIQWRESAWQYATQLAGAADDAERREIAREIEDNANGWAQAILAGASYTPLQNADARNARCAQFGGQDPGYDRGSDTAKPARKAKLEGRTLVVKVRCPNGPGPCHGTFKARKPRGKRARGADRFKLIARERYEIEAGDSARLKLRLRRRDARALRRHPGRGVWTAARSQLEPGLSLNKRRKSRLRVTR